jgi:hypothetical protein
MVAYLAVQGVIVRLKLQGSGEAAALASCYTTVIAHWKQSGLILFKPGYHMRAEKHTLQWWEDVTGLTDLLIARG